MLVRADGESLARERERVEEGWVWRSQEVLRILVRRRETGSVWAARVESRHAERGTRSEERKADGALLGSWLWRPFMACALVGVKPASPVLEAGRRLLPQVEQQADARGRGGQLRLEALSVWQHAF